MTTDAARPASPPPVTAPPGAPAPGAVPPGPRGSEFAELSRQVQAAGLMRRRPGWYAGAIGVNLALLAAGWTAFALLGRSWWQLAVAAFLGVMFTQTAFLGHDAGHRQVARSRRACDLVGRLHGNLLTGLSYTWWTSKHNRHHAHPNQEGRDPDIASKALTFTPGQTRARRRVGRAVARYQAWLFFPMLLLEGLNLHLAGIRETVDRLRGRGHESGRGSRAADTALLAVHHAGYLAALLLVLGPVQALAFLAVHQAVFGVYMGCSFAPNHKGMPVLGRDERPDFLRGQVLTSRNVRGGWLVHVALGGLGCQIEHHLFPSMPRPALLRVRPIVREFCERRGISYRETSLTGSYALVLRHLDDAGKA